MLTFGYKCSIINIRERNNVNNTTNKNIANQFFEMADLLDKSKTNPNDGFRVIAYQKIAKILSNLKIDLSTKSVKEIQNIDGIGKSSAMKIYEALHSKNYTINKLKKLRKTNSKIDKNGNEWSDEEMFRPINAVIKLNNPNIVKQFKSSKHPNTICYLISMKTDNKNRFTKMIEGVSKPVKNENNKNRIHRIGGRTEFYVYFLKES